MHILKRKSHHRLFDTTSHRFISLEGVHGLADSGEEIRVVDGRTGRDVTRRALPRLLGSGRRETDQRSLASDVLRLGAGATTLLLSLLAGVSTHTAHWLAGRPAAEPRRAGPRHRMHRRPR